MRNRNSGWMQLAAIALLALAARPAAAATMAQRAKAYADRNGLPVREVAIAGRGEPRVFVPVTAESLADFQKEFTSPGIVYKKVQDEHLTVGVSPDQDMHYHQMYQQLGGPGQISPRAALDAKATYIALGLTPEQQAHFVQTTQVGQQGRRGNCMAWLMNAQVAPNVPLPHAVGVRRSNSLINQGNVFVRSGDEHVVVGIPVVTAGDPQQAARNQLNGLEAQLNAARQQIAQLSAANQVAPQAQIAALDQQIAQRQAFIQQRRAFPVYRAQVQANQQQIALLTQQRDGLARGESPNKPQIDAQQGVIARLEQQVAGLKDQLGKGTTAPAAVQAFLAKSDNELLGPEPAGRANSIRPQP